MFGPLTVGKKATKFGYKRFGVPGAVIAGVGAVAGYVAIKRKLASIVKDTGEDEPAEEPSAGGASAN
ncbi:hypothetical protein [Halegenticoccus tardaugens]|uniref:hypothetical protein n=1 Tax=Halegenticoccus tardaugens TaxID=2071624 RepID=UPI00100B85FE|nr:hypothetical protein [Halegenticoccus tardaugens]